MLEFRIYSILFYQQFNLQLGAFAFDEYVQRLFEKYILEMVIIVPTGISYHIKPLIGFRFDLCGQSDWIIVMIFAAFSIMRKQLKFFEAQI
jgi:hypothetical protein